jgi:phosphatidylserine/phosphatidylglycerophosphate/cardiolipin synthase-like enzyme
MRERLESWATVGALLLRADDVPGASQALEQYLRSPGAENAAALARLGVDERLASDLALVLVAQGDDVRLLCELGAAWALGRRSVARPPAWEPVVTSGDVTDEGLDRMTAETLIGLVVGARQTVRLFSAYVDHGGLDVVAVSLAAGTRRGVKVNIGYSAAGDRRSAIEPFVERLEKTGDGTNLRVVKIPAGRPFPHAKLLAADGARAYIGSANLTWPALTSNAEVGALVDGEPVRVLERWFDSLLDGDLARDGEPPSQAVWENPARP